MFVPDDAKKRRKVDELTPSAWLVYESHCERRYKKGKYRGLSFRTKEEVAEAEGLALKTVWNATTELRRKGWIRDEGDAVRLLVGDFSPVDELPETGNEIPDSGKAIPGSGKEIPQTGNEIPDSGNGAYKGSRARSLLPSPAIASTHTPAPPAAEPPREEAPAARVCVDGLTFEDYLGYARSEPGFNNPPAWAMKHFTARDADPLVAEWKGRREQVLECRAPDADQLTPYHVAAQTVSSVAKLPGYDVSGYIAQMQGVSEETRAKLRRAFVQAPAAGEVAARAHAPP